MKEEHSKKTHREHRGRNEKPFGVWKILTVVALALLVVNLYITSSIANNINILNAQVLEGSDNVKAQQPENNPPTQQPPQPTVDMNQLIDDDIIKGDPNAPVTIVEFSDFECPFCARFFEQTLPQIQQNYIDTGKVKFVYRDFPLSIHQNAQKSAEAAECAGEQGKFWEMHDKLFESGVSGGVNSFKQYAADLGLNTAEFNDCLDSGKMASEVQKDMDDGAAIGIRGTPGFIINGVLVSGAQPYSVFEQVIDQMLV